MNLTSIIHNGIETPATETTATTATNAGDNYGRVATVAVVAVAPKHKINSINDGLSQCSECQHDKRSPYNPTGGLTGCCVRNDVPLMLLGTRKVGCSMYEAASNDL